MCYRVGKHVLKLYIFFVFLFVGVHKISFNIVGNVTNVKQTLEIFTHLLLIDNLQPIKISPCINFI